MAQIFHYAVSIFMFQFRYIYSRGHFDFFLDQSSYSIGEINVKIRCYRLLKSRQYMRIQIRNKITNDFETFVRLNTSGVYLESKGTSIHGLSVDGQCHITDGCYIEAFMRMHIDQCIDHPAFRCQASLGNILSSKSAKSVRLTKGRSPKTMHIPSIIARTKIKTEDLSRFRHVLQLQCTGEVESINGRPSQNIRWCKNVSGDFIVMALQDPPFTATLSKSKDGCIIMQRSMTYYSVLGSSDDQIMCESGYLESNTICGKGSAYSTLQIQTSDLEQRKG